MELTKDQQVRVLVSNYNSHVYSPIHDLMSDCSIKPSLQLQLNPPSVLVHN